MSTVGGGEEVKAREGWDGERLRIGGVEGGGAEWSADNVGKVGGAWMVAMARRWSGRGTLEVAASRPRGVAGPTAQAVVAAPMAVGAQGGHG